MNANALQRDSLGRAGTSKSGGKARARSKSQSEMSQDADSQKPPAPPTVLGKIPRPPNAFILYRKSKTAELKDPQTSNQCLSDAGLDRLDYQRQLSVIIGKLWRNETVEVKAAFYEKAQQAAREHAERYPDYRFKPSSKKAALRKSDSSVNNTMPERHGDTDFAPGDLSGPLSGSGSGSGRKRASLDGARSRASPYSTDRHRRTSSSDPVSPMAYRGSIDSNQQPAPVLLYSSTYEMPGHSLVSAPLTRSVSFGASSRSQSSYEKRNLKTARRSLDGQVTQSAGIITSFDTLVPQHLRETRVFLAPPPQPPLPIGQAITTDQPILVHETQNQRQKPSKPKCSLFDAVKKALPPERRAFLEASLTAKLSNSTELPSTLADQKAMPHYTTSSQSSAPLSQGESSGVTTGAAINLGHGQTWPSQESMGIASSQMQYPQGHSELAESLDLARQAPLAVVSRTEPSINLRLCGPAVANYADLGDWSQPDPCWLDYTQSQNVAGRTQWPSAQSSSSYASKMGADGLEHQSEGFHYDSQTQSIPLPYSFDAVDVAQYVPSDHEIDTSNSAFLALSQPNNAGQVQGQFYGLDGQLIGQGMVTGPQLGGLGYLEEEARQRRAVDELLMLMMASSQPSNSVLNCNLHPDLIQTGDKLAQDSSRGQLPSAFGQAPWQSWSQESNVKPEDHIDYTLGQRFMIGGSPYIDSSNTHCPEVYAQDSFQPGSSQPQSTASAATGQECTDGSAQGEGCAQQASPRTSKNYSRPILYDASPPEAPHSTSVSPSTVTATSNEADQEQYAEAVETTVDPAHLILTPEPAQSASQPQSRVTNQQKVHQKLRNWKADRISSLRDKVARVKNKATPSIASGAQAVKENADET